MRKTCDRKIAKTNSYDLVQFLSRDAERKLNVQGLPTNIFSVQMNSRNSVPAFPLLIDPQGQGLSWIVTANPEAQVLSMEDSKFWDRIEFAMAEGTSVIISNVGEEIDPMLDPVLRGKSLRKRSQSTLRWVSCEFNENFQLYLAMPGLQSSPSATMIVDFTVTMKGLEDQLLGFVIKEEHSALEDQLEGVLQGVAENKRKLAELNEQLLKRLTENSGNLLDDSELIGVLATTKSAANKVNENTVAEETRLSINAKREQYRPVATRGIVIFFAIVDMARAKSNVSNVSRAVSAFVWKEYRVC